MKANEAPEKLYFFKGEPILSARSKKAEGTDIEYTRTDAFIEKAAQWLYDNLHWADPSDFLEDFEKYMKGE